MGAVEELRTRMGEITSRLTELEVEADGKRFTDGQTAEWNDLNKELEDIREHVVELEARQARIEEISRVAGSVESEERTYARRGEKKRVPDDPSDLTAYRQVAGSYEELHDSYRDGALRIIERMSASTPDVDVAATQARLDHLLREKDNPEERALAKRIIATSSPTYARAWSKKIAGQLCTAEEERALSHTTTAGGYAVPYTLDPTVILTSAGSINPVRRLARVETITGNTWYGVSSTGVSAAYSAAATETSDGAPTLAQPSATVAKAQAFIPYSIEIGEDWTALQSEMGRMFAEAKDDLENTQFLTGLGSNAPQGLIAVGGATAVVSTATTAVLAVADLYSLEIALQERSRARASWVADKAFYQKVRQFDTYGGANLWQQLAYGDPATLLGYPAYEWSAYSGALTTSGSTVATFGDFSKFLIVDRVGMNVELVPHLFGGSSRFPTGQRGLYCYWRNTSSVLSPGLSANSAFQSLKIL